MRFLLVPFAALLLAPGVFAAEPDALDQVNAQRAARGLRPFARDEGLTVAARGAATYRASVRLFGHVQGGIGDFQFLPPGVSAAAAGCAAYPASYGFMACCTYDSYTHAGAASVTGADGKQYNHIFVNNGPTAHFAGGSVESFPAAATCTAAGCSQGVGAVGAHSYAVTATVRTRVTIRERIANRPRLFGRGCR